MRFRELDQHYLESEAGPGGWYPLGANQTWHNGIHLTRPRNRVVRAVAPGRIVAARFARNDELDGYSFGSPGFVLVKHRADAFPAEPVRSGKVGDSSLGRVTTEITFVRDLETGKDWQQLPIGSIVEVVEGGGAESNNSSRKNESSSSGTITHSEMGCRRYTIEKGDTLSEIAQRHGMTWRQLYNFDGGTGTPNRSRLRSGNPDKIYPGEVILVPGSSAQDDKHRRVRVITPGNGSEVGWIHEGDLREVERIPDASRLMKIATSKDGGGLNCWARTDSGDNVLKSIPEGTEVRVYTQKIRASGDVWQAVRAPDQDIPFGWIVTSEDRVRPVEGDEETTTEFYSLYMNVAWEGPERTEELVPWMLPYYQHVFDQKITLSLLQAMARLAEDAPFKLKQEHAAETLPENYVVIPRNEFTTMNGEEWQKVVVPSLKGGLTTGWLLTEKDVLDAFSSAEVDVGRIETDEDENTGLRYRSWTDFTRENVVGIANKGEKAYLSEAITSQKNDWKWRLATFEEGEFDGKGTYDGGWVAAEKSGEEPNVAVPEDFKKTAKKLEKGRCVKLDIPVQAGEPIANVGLIHPREMTEDLEDDQWGVHLEVFSDKNFFNDQHMVNGGWRLVEDDSDKNVICRSKDAISEVAQQLKEKDAARLLIETLGWGGIEASTHKDVAEKREELRDELRSLRTLITRNTSYWAVDWQKVKDKNEEWAREFDFDDEDAKAAEKYTWWQECVDKEVPLPDKPFVYHYHPIAFLEYLEKQLPRPERRDARSQHPRQAVSCEKDPCPIEKALDLQNDYFEALEALKEAKTEMKDGVPLVDRLKMAEFVREAAARAAGEKVVIDEKSGKVKFEDAPGEKPRQAGRAWSSLRTEKYQKSSLGREGHKKLKKPEKHPYENTYLKTDIDGMEEKIDEKRREANDAARRLVDHIGRKEFQEHLDKFHAHTRISQKEAKTYYGVEELPPASEQDYLLYSEKNHYLARLTDRLIATKAGRKLLDHILGIYDLGVEGKKYEVEDPKGPPSTKLFKDGLGMVKKALSAKKNLQQGMEMKTENLKETIPEPVSKLFANVTTRAKNVVDEQSAELLEEVQELHGRMDSIDQLLSNDRVSRALTTLEDTSGFKIKDWVRSKADYFSDRAGYFFEVYKSEKSANVALRKNYNDVCNQNLPKGLEDTRYVPDHGARISAVLGMVAFGVSVPGIVQKWVEDDVKIADALGFLGDAAGVVEGYVQVVEGQAKTRFGVAWVNRADEAAETAATKARTAGAAAKVLGVLGGLITAGVGYIKAHKAFENENLDKLLYNLVQIGVGVAAIYLSLWGTPVATGIFAVIGIVMIISAYFKDISTIDYLQKTYWGVNSSPKDPKISIVKTVDEYYKHVHKIDVRFVNPAYVGAEESHIKITSSAIRKASPIYVRISPKIDHTSKSQNLCEYLEEVDLEGEDFKRIYPSSKNIDGKGKIMKTNWSDVERKLFGSQGVIIKNYWEIWNIERDSKKEYYINVFLDPDGDREPELCGYDMTVFPKKGDPALNKHYDAFPDGIPKYVPGIGGRSPVQYVPYDNGSNIRFRVKTDRAVGCKVHVHVSKDDGITDLEKEVGHYYGNITDEEKEFMVPKQGDPGVNDYYQLTFEWYLKKDENRVGNTESETIRVARWEYIEKKHG